MNMKPNKEGFEFCRTCGEMAPEDGPCPHCGGKLHMTVFDKCPSGEAFQRADLPKAKNQFTRKGEVKSDG
jgi:hypothetical protein